MLTTAGAQHKTVGGIFDIDLLYFFCPSHRNGVESPNFECERIEPGQLSIEPGQLYRRTKYPHVFLAQIIKEDTFLSCT